MEFEQSGWFVSLVRRVLQRLVNYFLFTLLCLLLFSLVLLVIFAYFANPAQAQALGETLLAVLQGLRAMSVS